jgi:hypothetical protein
VDYGGGKRAELQLERKTITGPKLHGPHAAAEAQNDRKTLCKANTSLATLQAAAAALKAAAAASKTPAERNERSWIKQQTVDPMDADESGVSQPVFSSAARRDFLETSESGVSQPASSGRPLEESLASEPSHPDVKFLREVFDGTVLWGGWAGGVEEKDNLQIGVIERSHLYLPDASPMEINVSRRGLLIAKSAAPGSVIFNGQLQADGSLHWDDGTVWTRCEVDYDDDMFEIAVELPSSIQRHASGTRLPGSIEYVFSVRKDETTSYYCEAAHRASLQWRQQEAIDILRWRLAHGGD